MRVAAVTALGLALLLAACGRTAPQTAPAASAWTVPAGPTARSDGPSGPTGQVADPVRVRIPDIGVDAAVVPLAVDAAGTLEAPTDFATTGWNVAGPEPGEKGVAVIAGHVDSRTGPAVFYRLGSLRPGARVLVDRADGSTAAFVVDRLARYAKATLPSAEVYGGRPDAPGLRLITCGGAFDRARGHYLDNVIAFASAD